MKILILGGDGLVGSSFDYGIKATRKDADLMNFSEVQTLIKLHNPDWVINCAGKVGGLKSNIDYKLDYFMDNMIINMNVIKACMDYGVPNLISFMSTCIFPEMYANLGIKLNERLIHDGEPHSTNYGYAYAKRMVDIMSRMAREKGFNYSCIIPTNLYGENDNFDLESSHVVPALIKKVYDAIKEQSPNKNIYSVESDSHIRFNVWGSGKPIRQLLYSKDIPMIVNHIIDNNIMFDNLIISTEQSYSISQIVDCICLTFRELLNKNLHFIPFYEVDKPDGQNAKKTDTSKFQELIKLELTPFRLGLKKTILAYINQQQKI